MFAQSRATTQLFNAEPDAFQTPYTDPRINQGFPKGSALIELILGGVRSGKSREAQNRAERSGWPVTFVATATPSDPEMASRIERHRSDRPSHWSSMEVPLHLAATLTSEAQSQRCLIVDCMTIWLTNWLMEGDESLPTYQRERDRLLQCLPELPGHVILVSNETNQGVIPMTALARRFCDEAGWLHQELARISDRVSLMVAGIALDVKQERI